MIHPAYVPKAWQQGALDRNKLLSMQVALRAMGFPVKKAEVLQLLERHNEGDASSIALPAFEAICGEKIHARSPEDEYKLVFQLLSYQTAGVSAENLQDSAVALGLTMSEDESAEMIAEFDADQDGILNEFEFAGVFKAADKF